MRPLFFRRARRKTACPPLFTLGLHGHDNHHYPLAISPTTPPQAHLVSGILFARLCEASQRRVSLEFVANLAS